MIVSAAVSALLPSNFVTEREPDSTDGSARIAARADDGAPVR